MSNVDDDTYAPEQDPQEQVNPIIKALIEGNGLKLTSELLLTSRHYRYIFYRDMLSDDVDEDAEALRLDAVAYCGVSPSDTDTVGKLIEDIRLFDGDDANTWELTPSDTVESPTKSAAFDLLLSVLKAIGNDDSYPEGSRNKTVNGRRLLAGEATSLCVRTLITDNGQLDITIMIMLEDAGYSVKVVEKDRFGPLICGLLIPNRGYLYFG